MLCGAEGAWACPECAPASRPTLWQLDDGLNAQSLFSFEDPAVRELLHHLKYNGVYEAAEALVDRADLSALDLPLDAMLIPVPVSFRRRKERGYNQAELLAACIGRRLGLGVWDGLVRRHAATLVGQGGEARRGQEQRFSWGDRELPPGPWVVVDDICTTGTTLQQCAQVLREREARVAALVVARA